MGKNWDKVAIEANLISLPDIYWQLKEIIDSRDFSLQDVAQPITYDPGLTARLLKIVNSSFFGFATQIGTVQHAVSILGIQQIEELVLTTSIADALGDYECEHLDVKQFWLGSVYRAIAARNLASECGLKYGERMFVAGLLSDIGRLITYQSVPVLAQQAQRLAEDSGKPLHLMEREVMGFDHAQVGAMLMQNWKLPASHVSVIRNHLELDPDDEFYLDTAIVHIAAVIGNAFDDHLPLDEMLVRADNRAWDVTGLDTGRCEAVDRLAAEQLNGVINLLFPKMPVAV